MKNNKTVKYLTVSLESEINPWEITSFRAAVAERIGFEHDIFHNHNHKDDDNEPDVLYRYPLVQYKIFHRKPTIVCIGEGYDQIYRFFTIPEQSLIVNGRDIPIKIDSLQINNFEFGPSPKPIMYRIFDWMPFNSENFATWQTIDNDDDRLDFLESILFGNIKAMASGIGIAIPEDTFMSIRGIHDSRWISYKDVKMLTFTLTVKLGIKLPDLIGLGLKPAVGFGIIKKMDTLPDVPARFKKV